MQSESIHVVPMRGVSSMARRGTLLFVAIPLLAMVVIASLLRLASSHLFFSNTVSSSCGVAQLEGSGEEKNHPLGHRTSALAVIHVGVHKTGSTSIQTDSETFWRELKKDRYEMPWALYEELTPKKERISTKNLTSGMLLRKNHANFATCFLPLMHYERVKFPCMPHLLLKGLQTLDRGSNLFVSSEIFDGIQQNGIQDLAAYLKPWEEVLIVLYYRRFFSWVTSMHNQIRKVRKWNETDLWDCNILHFISNIVINETGGDPLAKSHPDGACSSIFLRWGGIDGFKDLYTVPFLERLRPSFPNITLLNFHDESNGGPSEAFFCTALPIASHHTCKAVQSQPSPTLANTGVSLDYGDIAYGAWKAGVVNISSDRDLAQLTGDIHKYNEEYLNQTASHFPRLCPNANVLQKLWAMSMNYERKILPSFGEIVSNGSSPYLGEEAMRIDFESSDSQTKFCTLNVQSVLSEKRWQHFFAEFHN